MEGQETNQVTDTTQVTEPTEKTFTQAEFDPDVGLLVMWFVVSLLLCVGGVRKIYKEENSYVKAI